jgi:hypothetical protein
MILQENQDKTWIQERKKELEALLEFANAEIQVMEAREMATLAYDCSLFEGDRSWGSFILRNASRDFIPDPQDLSRKKKDLVELQDHFKGKLEEIMWATETGQQATIFEVTGTTMLTAHPSKDRFLVELKEINQDATPLEKEKIRLDFRLVDLARIFGLKPGRFKKCLQCKHIFYQSSFKERVYCSPKCSGAHRQEEFQKRKKSYVHRDLKGKNVIEAGREVIDELKNS